MINVEVVGRTTPEALVVKQLKQLNLEDFDNVPMFKFFQPEVIFFFAPVHSFAQCAPAKTPRSARFSRNMNTIRPARTAVPKATHHISV